MWHLKQRAIKDIIQLKITLQETEPPIWRRILVDKSTAFSKFHYIILTTMGWGGGHLYEFKINGCRVGVPQKDDEDWGGKLVDASKISLDSLISDKKVKFMYTYDFGDSWEHLIKVEKFLEKEENIKYPICIDGELNCPPEDCGGIPGFYNLLDIIGDKQHPEHKEMLEWLGGQYDSEHFDKKGINIMIEKLMTKSTKKATRRQT